MAEATQGDPIVGTIIDAALENGVNPALALAVAHQESGGLNPQARNPQGEGYGTGLFGFIPSTAKAQGMPWDKRYDPVVSSQYGTQYLRRLLDQTGGDVPQALRLYGGADAPGGDTQYDTHVLAQYPRYAHYAGLRRTQAGASPAVGRAEQEPSVEDLVQAGSRVPSGEQAARAPAPAPPMAGAEPSVADLVQLGTAPEASSGAAAPAGGPGSRVRLDLPGQAAPPTTLAPAMPLQTQDVGAMPGIGQAAPVPPGPTTPPASPAAGAPSPAPTSGGWLGEAAARQAAAQGATTPEGAVEQFLQPTESGWRQVAGAGTRLGTTLGGAQVGGKLAGPYGAVGGAILGGLASNWINQAAGLEPPQPPLAHIGPVPVTTGDVLAVAGPLVPLAMQGWKSWMAGGPAGTALLEADKATEAAREAWAKSADAARAAQAAGQADKYAAAMKEAREAQAAYRTSLGQYQSAAEKAGAYDAAKAAQEQALKTTGAVPKRYAPDTPASVLYNEFGDIARSAEVHTAEIPSKAQEMLAARGTMVTGEPRPVPTMMQPFVDRALAIDPMVTADTIRNEMRTLGPLTRSANGEIRGVAKQLFGMYGEALESSAAHSPETAQALDRIQLANATFRKEMALQDVAEWFQPGERGAVVRTQGGRLTINTDRLLDKWQAALRDPLFAKSFTAEERAAITRDFESVRGTPSMPRGERPSVPTTVPTPPEALPGGAPWAREPPVTIPPEPPGVEPTLTRPQLKLDIPTIMGTLAAGHFGGTKGAIGVLAAREFGPQVPYLLAKGLLSPSWRPMVMNALKSGKLSADFIGRLSGGLAQGGRMAVERLPSPGESPVGDWEQPSYTGITR